MRIVWLNQCGWKHRKNHSKKKTNYTHQSNLLRKSLSMLSNTFFFLWSNRIFEDMCKILINPMEQRKSFFLEKKTCMITKLWCIEWHRFRLKVNASFLTKYLIEKFATNIARVKWPVSNVVDAQFDHHIKILNNFTYILLRSALPRYGNHDKQLR